jgi:phosphoserine phosphatase
MNTIIFHSQDIEIASNISTNFSGEIEPRASHIRIHTSKLEDLRVYRDEYKLDFNYLPNYFDFNNASMYISDMDSTLINIECIDEIADFANIKNQIADITQRAMNGELNFDLALVERVSLLNGLDFEVLEKVYNERLKINPGGKELINFLKSKSIKTGVVSGGFTYFTDKLSKRMGLDYSLANKLSIKNEKLTGKIEGPIINAAAKANFVKELCEINSVSDDSVITSGDGANDLEMMRNSGLSIAYHAKPLVMERSNIVISYSGLDKIMDFFDD